jgi:hypothetical protein
LGVAVTPVRFPILFTGANKAMAVLGILPRWGHLDVDDDEVRVRMSWAFHAVIPRASIQSATPYSGPVYGWGAHGWRGAWLVNGSSKNLVDLEIAPPARARTLVFPLRLRKLRVSVVDPDGLIDALS